jgi:hypothetical protein
LKAIVLAHALPLWPPVDPDRRQRSARRVIFNDIIFEMLQGGTKTKGGRSYYFNLT